MASNSASPSTPIPQRQPDEVPAGAHQTDRAFLHHGVAHTVNSDAIKAQAQIHSGQNAQRHNVQAENRGFGVEVIPATSRGRSQGEEYDKAEEEAKEEGKDESTQKIAVCHSNFFTV
jgi:hypothetical protein